VLLLLISISKPFKGLPRSWPHRQAVCTRSRPFGRSGRANEGRNTRSSGRATLSPIALGSLSATYSSSNPFSKSSIGGSSKAQSGTTSSKTNEDVTTRPIGTLKSSNRPGIQKIKLLSATRKSPRKRRSSKSTKGTRKSPRKCSNNWKNLKNNPSKKKLKRIARRKRVRRNCQKMKSQSRMRAKRRSMTLAAGNPSDGREAPSRLGKLVGRKARSKENLGDPLSATATQPKQHSRPSRQVVMSPPVLPKEVRLD
jgi:hypothetical protein